MTDYKVVRMRRRTISISVDKDLNTIVKAPFSVSSVFIENFVNRHEEFIEKAKRIRSDEINFFSEYEHENMIRQLKSKGREYIPARLSYFSDITDLYPFHGVSPAQKHVLEAAAEQTDLVFHVICLRILKRQ